MNSNDELTPIYTESFEENCKDLLQTLEQNLNDPKVTAKQFLELVYATSLQPKYDHTNKSEPEFYNNLYNHVLASLQSASKGDVDIASALGYLDTIRFAGLVPRFISSPFLFEDVEVAEVVPVFDFYCDPHSTTKEGESEEGGEASSTPILSFRVGVSSEDRMMFTVVNLDWLQPHDEVSLGIEEGEGVSLGNIADSFETNVDMLMSAVEPVSNDTGVDSNLC